MFHRFTRILLILTGRRRLTRDAGGDWDIRITEAVNVMIDEPEGCRMT
jgi:hypothetical protein